MSQLIIDHLGVMNKIKDIEKYQVQWRTHVFKEWRKIGCLRKHYYRNLREGEILGCLEKDGLISFKTHYNPWRPNP